MDSNDIKNSIRALCYEGLEGKLYQEDFDDRWKDEFNGSDLYREIYDDLEDAVEHLPGYFY